MLSDHTSRWLRAGHVAEGDWASHVLHLALNGELGHVEADDATLLLDLPALTQPYACRTSACAPHLRGPNTRSCCADLDVQLEPAEQAAITAALPALAPALAQDPRHRDGPLAPFQGAHLARPGGRCTFAIAGPTGLSCALHQHELTHDLKPGTLKPLPCRLFPLALVELGEDRVLLTALAPHTQKPLDAPPAKRFPCLRGDVGHAVSLAQAETPVLTQLLGAPTTAEVLDQTRSYLRRSP